MSHFTARAGRPLLSGLVFALALLTGALDSAATQAADSSETERLIREGNDLRRAGNVGAALPLFQRAHSLAHTPRTAAQLGLVEFSLGYSLEAEAHLMQALSSPNDPWVSSSHAVLIDVLAKVRATIGELAVSGTPTGAEVFLNGRSVGHLPLAAPLRTSQGPATIEIRASDHASASSTIEVTGGRRKEVTLHLTAAPTELTRAALPEKTDQVDGLSLKQGPDRPLRPPAGNAGNEGRGRSIVGWSLVGAGLASAAGGAIWLWWARDCQPMTGFECSRESPSSIPGLVLVGGGAAAALTGGLMLLTRPSPRIQLGLTGGSVFLMGHL